MDNQKSSRLYSRLGSGALVALIALMMLVTACTAAPAATPTVVVESIATGEAAGEITAEPTAAFTATPLPTTGPATVEVTVEPTISAPIAATSTAVPTDASEAIPVREELGFTVETQLGGTTQAVAVQDNIAYLGIGPRLFTVDVTNPTTPQLLWRSEVLPDLVHAVAVQNDVAYVALGRSGLNIFDIGDPASPVLLSGLGDFDDPQPILVEVVVVGDIVYALDLNRVEGSQRLMVIDVSDPTQPVVQKRRSLPVSTTITAAGNVLYLASDGRIQLIGRDNPENALSEITLPAESYSVRLAVVGNLAYVASSGPENRIQVFDVSDPTQPEEVSTTGDISLPFIAHMAATSESIFAVWTFGEFGFCSSGIVAFDIADGATPQQTVEFDPQSCINDIATSGDTLFAASRGGLRIFDVSDPANLSLLGEFGPPAGFNAVENIALNQDTAYIITSEGQGARFLALDRTAPTGPALISDPLDIEAGFIDRLFAQDNTLYLTVWMNGVRVVDINDPDRPRLLGQLTDIQFGDFLGSATFDDAIYATAPTGFHVVDVSDPANPTVANTVSTSALMVTGLTEANGHLFVAGQEAANFVQLFDLSDPLAPAEIASIELPEPVNRFAVAGDFLYAACNHGNCHNLYVIDISDLANPAVAGRFALPFDVVNMIGADQTIYITTTEGTLLALDVSGGAMPVLVGRLSLAGQELNLAVDDDLLYVAAGDAGLYVVQVER